jgi:hypothetical protein
MSKKTAPQRLGYISKHNHNALSAMYNSHLILSALLVVSAQNVFANQDEYGRYTNEKLKTTILVDLGPRGGTEFRSSTCKGEVFKPLFKDSFYEDKKGGFAIFFGGGNIHLEIEGRNKCFPEGRYKRIRD